MCITHSELYTRNEKRTNTPKHHDESGKQKFLRRKKKECEPKVYRKNCGDRIGRSF